MKAKQKIVMALLLLTLGGASRAMADYTRYDWNSASNSWSNTWVSSSLWGGDIYFNGASVVANNLVRIGRALEE